MRTMARQEVSALSSGPPGRMSFGFSNKTYDSVPVSRERTMCASWSCRMTWYEGAAAKAASAWGVVWGSMAYSYDAPFGAVPWSM